ncbi:hypothetical protein [Cytobacillus oceanisediminis]|uniref:hypothetical protein n=1 Tax=Cytobacillus oceanisediminis TaxID=665099 RepID=UPI00207A8C9E|nr:hypothetical protein [Cytobacillus oceanisediminis]USK44629.1 hypothetical protein LIT27_01660 [Cytobacillus oceanisediminis]
MLFTKAQRHINLKAATLGQLLYIARYEDKDAAHRELLRRRIALGSYEPTENNYLSGLQPATKEQEERREGIGPVCERKLEKLENEPDEDQLKMELKDRK